MNYLITTWQQLKCTKWLHFPVIFEECAILPANIQNLKWKCWLLCVQETICHEIYPTRHRKASPFQPWWSVKGAIPIFDVNWCSLQGSMFCVCLLWLGLAVTGAPAENFRTRIRGVTPTHTREHMHPPHPHPHPTLAHKTHSPQSISEHIQPPLNYA